MKKIVLATAGAALLAMNANAANIVISAHHGQSLATFANSDDDNDDNDGLSFFDHYTDGSQDYMPFNNVSLSGESAVGGGDLQLKYENKSLTQTYMSGWINFAQPFGTPGILTLKFGRFDAYANVDYVKDANRGLHYSSYAVNPLYDKQAGFSAQVMSWFLARQGFAHGTHSRVVASYEDMWAAQGDDKALSGYSWFFNDANNAGANITYYSSYHSVHPSFMVQYALNEDLVFRFLAKEGSASNKAATYAHDFYGEKTFTNWNAQVNAKIGDIAKLGLTVKMSDMLSGSYYTGAGQWKSAGTDLNASLAVSSDSLVEGLRLFAGYGFAGVYMGMSSDVGTKKDASEMYMFHAVDLRAVYDIDELLSVGLNTNVSMINQSEWAKESGYDDDYLGFNVGLSASYALSDTLAIDFNTGFRCLNVNNKVGTERGKSTTTDGDMMAVSSIGVEPSLVFTLNKNASLSVGVNLLIQNLSSKDVGVNTWQANNMANYYATTAQACYPFTTTVTLPLYMSIRI